jgi:hypothetical protein
VSSTDPRFKPATATVAPSIVFKATDTNWATPVVVTVSVNPSAPAEDLSQPKQRFFAQPHVVADLYGPLAVEGGTIKQRPVVQGVRLPTETDVALPVLVVTTDETLQTDTLNVFNDGSREADTGALDLVSAAHALALEEIYEKTLSRTDFGHISGLGMGGPLTYDFGTASQPRSRTFAAGIAYHEMEVVDIRLGTNDDRFTVHTTLPGTITVVQGGGGSDTITVLGGGGPAAPLVIFGDGSQDGRSHDSHQAVDGRILQTGRARQFTNPGDDVIDASASTLGVVIYGGRGNDRITGSQGADHIAGGSGDDRIDAAGGNDHVYADDGFNLDLRRRLSVVTAMLAANPATAPQILLVAHAPGTTDFAVTADALTAGADDLRGGTGDDILLGDHGRIDQRPGPTA